MNKEQEKQVKKKVINILNSEDYKDSACAKNSFVVIQAVLDDMNADNVQHITDMVVMQYFQSVFFDKEMTLEKVIEIRKATNSNGVSTQAPKSKPVTAKLTEEMVKRLAYRVGRMWRIEAE